MTIRNTLLATAAIASLAAGAATAQGLGDTTGNVGDAVADTGASVGDAVTDTSRSVGDAIGDTGRTVDNANANVNANVSATANTNTNVNANGTRLKTKGNVNAGVLLSADAASLGTVESVQSDAAGNAKIVVNVDDSLDLPVERITVDAEQASDGEFRIKLSRAQFIAAVNAQLQGNGSVRAN